MAISTTKKKPGRHLTIYLTIGNVPSVVQAKAHSRRRISMEEIKPGIYWVGGKK